MNILLFSMRLAAYSINVHQLYPKRNDRGYYFVLSGAMEL